MPLQRQLVDVPIVGGVDEHTDARLVARPVSLVNCCQRKAGALEKRYGSELVLSRGVGDRLTAQIANPPPTSTPPTPLHLTEVNGALVRVGARYLHTTTTGTVWNRADYVPSVDVTRTPVAISTSQAWSGDVASDGVRLCHVWCEANSRFGTGGVWAQITNAATGEVITASYYFGQGRQVKTCWLGSGEFIVTWVDSVTGNIKACATDTTGTIWSAPVTIITNGIKTGGTLVTAYALEACSTVYAIAYETSTPAVVVSVFTSLHSLALTTSTGFILTPVTSIALKWQDDAPRLWWSAIGVFGSVKRMQYGSLDNGFNVETSNTTVEDTEGAVPVVANQTYQNMGIEVASSVACTIVYDTCIDSTDTGIALVTVDTSSNVGPISRMRGDLSVTSRPWTVDGRMFFTAALSPRWGQGYADANHLVFEAALQSETDICRPVGRFGPSIGLYALPFSHVSGVVVSGSDARIALSFAADTQGANTSLWSCKVTYQTLPRRTSVELGGALYLSGGALSVFDGTTVAEVGFFEAPGIESTSTTAASSPLTAGDYTYVFTWEGIDAAGRAHRSPPSVPVTVTASAGDRIDIEVRQISATTKQDDFQSGAPSGHWPFAVNLVGHRLVNGEYYRCPSSIGGQQNYYLAYSQVFSDDGVASITSNAKLYTSGNVLPHVAPPGCRVLCAHQSRLFADSDDGTLWYSNPVAPGEVASFTLDFRIPPFEGGTVTALVSLDSTLVIFKESSIYLLGGQGPNATGGGEQYGLPQVLTADLGCLNPRSVVVCPLGIFFESRDGITLLTRGLTLNTDIGNRVEDFMSGATISAATHVPDQNQVRFELATRRLVYDYHQDAWSTDVLYLPDSASDNTSPVYGATLVNGVYTWVTADGSLYRETVASWLDSGTFVTMSGTLGNFRTTAIDGMHRLWRIAFNGYKYTPCGVVFGSSSWSWGEVEALYPGEGVRIQLQEHVADQLREYTQISFSDAQPDYYSLGTGRGFSLTGLTLEVGVRGSTSRRLPAAGRK